MGKRLLCSSILFTDTRYSILDTTKLLDKSSDLHILDNLIIDALTTNCDMCAQSYSCIAIGILVVSYPFSSAYAMVLVNIKVMVVA